MFEFWKPVWPNMFYIYIPVHDDCTPGIVIFLCSLFWLINLA